MDTSCLKISLVDEDENLEMFEVSEVEDESQECDDYLEINEIDAFSSTLKEKIASNTKLVSSLSKKSSENKDSLTQFSDYLEGEGEFNFDLISKCTSKQISTFLEVLLEYYYKHFNEVSFCKESLYKIYRKTRYTVKSKDSFLFASNEFFNQEFYKISGNSNWNDIVMFGAFLCKLLRHHKPGYFEVTKQLNTWIMELVNCSADGSEFGLIAFMLILWRLTKIFNPLSGSYDQLLKVLKILLKDGDAESKKIKISQFLEQVGYLNLEDYESLQNVKYKKETASSLKCKNFEAFLTTADDHALFNVAMFTDITDNEIEFFARKFVDVGIQEPKKINFLVYTAYRFQQIVSHIRRMEEEIVKNLDEEIEFMRKNEGKGTIELLNFAKFIGESYFYELELIPSKTLTNWLSLLTELGETDLIFTTLMLCGGLYKARDRENFDKFFEPLGDLRAVVKNEMKRVCEQFDINHMDTYIKYQESRRYQPTDSAKMIANFSLFLSEFSRDTTVNFDFLSLYEFKYFDTINATKSVIREIANPAANAIKVAEFFKSFFEFSVKLGKFIVELKAALQTKIAEMPIDRPDEMIRVGKLIGELRNLTIIEKYPQDKWLDMIESLKPFKNIKIMEIHLEVLKVMMYNLYIHEEDKYMTYLKSIKVIDTSDSKYPQKIKSKVLQIIHNSIPKKFDKSAKFSFIRMKSGSRFDGIPKDIPESSSTDFDIHDFVKFYFLSATNNPYCIENYLKSRKFLSFGQQGWRFGVIFNKFILERFGAITDPVYFDEHEAATILKFILQSNSMSIFTENSIATFLQNIIEFEDFDRHRECLRTLVRMILKARFNLLPRDNSRAIFCLWRKVQTKFVKFEDSGEENGSDEVEIWHLVDYQACIDNFGSTKSVSNDLSHLVWSFTENYEANQQKSQNQVEKGTKQAANIDSLAQNFKDWTQNFHKIQYSGRKVQKNVEPHDFLDDKNLTEDGHNSTKSNLNLVKTDQIFTESSQKWARIDQSSNKITENLQEKAQKFNSVENFQKCSNLVKNEQIESKIDVNPHQSKFSFTILPENPKTTVNFESRSINSNQNQQNQNQLSQMSTNYNKVNPRSDRKSRNVKSKRNSTPENQKNIKRNQKTNIEWCVTRGDLKDRNDLKYVDLPNVKKRFDPNSPLCQGSSQLRRNSVKKGENEEMRN